MTVSLFEELERETMPGTSRSRRGRLQILLLEDDETDRLRLTRVLHRSGLSADITETQDIKAFHKTLDRQAFDLVFIDYWLGFETGLDALRLLLAHPDQTRAAPVMLSRATEPQLIVDAMREGCIDYVIKDTLDVDTLRSCVAAAFERRILLAAMREAQDMRMAIRRLVDRLAQGRIPSLAEPGTAFQHKPTVKTRVAERLSSGLLADLELLWSLRRS